ncbi:MAG TPA: phosphomannomutase/phosphoglucomutase [Exilispira sp.]|nr:phosphomannomutase/phosphoglucomutase [Exilispira sp.]
MGIYKSYDIRGIYNKEWNKDIAYKIGNFIPQIFNIDKILIGRDARLSSNEIFDSLCEGLTDASVDVYDANLTTTPMIYFGTSFFEFPFSIMITASHNPKEYNGLKISGKNSVPIGYETGIDKIENAIVNNKLSILKNSKKGKVIQHQFYDQYIQFLNKYKNQNYSIDYVIDFSSGMASLFKDKLFNDAKKTINSEIDGNFPAHEPNPLEEENRHQIVDLVKKQNSDIGIIFDGDADRVMFIDEKGNFIAPDLIIALLGLYFKDRKPFNVLYDIRTSKSVDIFLTELGAKTYMWKVGHAYAKRKLKEIDGVFGGELAGHYYYKDFYFCDSGILTSLLVLNMVDKLKTDGITISQWIDKISKYYNSGEINFKINNKKEAIEDVINKISSKYEVKQSFDFDGYRLEFDNWWFNIRPSNTEPLLRLIIEANNKDLLEEKKSEIINIIKNFN